MRYFVTVEDRTFVVELAGKVVTVDGTEHTVDLAGHAGNAYRHMLLDSEGHAMLVRAGSARGEWEVQMKGRTLLLEALDERTRTIREMTGGATAQRSVLAVRAPMPGLILRIEVEPGQEVRAGQGVIVMEAMKMENELRADGGGVVARILVSTGQAVEKNAVLVEFEAS
jgi:biotin carboxyl carrier protein